jgi:hypothetical protein
MKIIVWLLTLMVSSSVVYSQNSNKRFATKDDVTRDSSVRRTISKSCQQYLSYMPDTLHPEFTPVRMVRINIHVMQDGKGQNNFSEEEGTRFIRQLITNANNRLGGNKKMNLPKDNTTPVLPIPYRYVLTGDPKVPGDDGIYFHRDDTLYSMNKKSKRKDNVYDRRQYEKYGVQKDSVINIL